MKRVICLIIVLFFVSSCTPSVDDGSDPIIVDFSIEPENLGRGDNPVIYMKAKDNGGLDKIAVDYGSGRLKYDCNGKKVCEHTWYLGVEASKVGRFTVLFGALDNEGNEVETSVYKVVDIGIDLPEFKKGSVSHGNLEVKDGVWVLNLDGTNYEMGYAQGYLIGGQIKALMTSALISTPFSESEIEAIIDNYIFSDKYVKELEGMYDGMVDSGLDMYIEEFDHYITVNDLKYINAFTELEESVLNLGCTTITIWDELAEKGNTISGRGLGWNVFTDIGSVMFNYVLIIARDPVEGNKWLNGGYPGVLGVVTGMNENGVVLFTNDIPRGVIDDNFPHTISTLVMRDFLEDKTVSNPALELDKLFDDSKPEGGRSITVAVPVGMGVVPVAAALEIDGADNLLRTSFDGLSYRLIVPNEFLEYKEVDLEDKRYNIVLNEIEKYSKITDTKIGKSEINDIFRIIADDTDAPAQQHILIADLDEMNFDFYLAEVDGGDFISASYGVKHSFSWDDFF